MEKGTYFSCEWSFAKARKFDQLASDIFEKRVQEIYGYYSSSAAKAMPYRQVGYRIHNGGTMSDCVDDIVKEMAAFKEYNNNSSNNTPTIPAVLPVLAVHQSASKVTNATNASSVSSVNILI